MNRLNIPHPLQAHIRGRTLLQPQCHPEAGKDIHVVGGAMLVSSMINLGLVDEIRLMINPILLGGGKSLFKGVTERHYLKFVSAERRDPGKVYVTYSVQHT